MNKVSLALLITVLLFAGVITVQRCQVSRLKNERDKYQLNNDALLSDIKQWQVDSATRATDSKILRLTIDELKRYRREDVEKIRLMGVKIKNLQSLAKHQMEVIAPINTIIRDSLIFRDTVPVTIKSFSMSTPYIQMSGTLEKDSLMGSIQLPVTLRQAIWVEYKRRWIFWKKVKAVHQTITTDNPYVYIKYSEYINIE